MRKESKVLSAVVASLFLMFIVLSASLNSAIAADSKSDMLKYGEKLWSDTSLSTVGVSCATCHPDGSGLYSEPYPKHIDMAKKTLTLEGIINYCMETPMKSKALASGSREMQGLKAYVLANSKATRTAAQPCGMNPCSMKNPCGKNPCDKNPCAMKNPCGKNPCMKNPCTAKNPCGKNPCSYNPCGMNPCSMKNPCSKNPCAKNPCSAKNPCTKNPCGVNPCAMKNPCGK